MTITQAQADEFLKQDCIIFEKHVLKFHNKYNWTQNEFDALVSFAFNIGSINQLTANGTRNKDLIAKKILEYNKGGGKILPGLVKRRQEEQTLFLKNKSINTLLKIGCCGTEVRNLQIKLDSMGYPVGAIDGIFGKLTYHAVINFQKDTGLLTDGIVGNDTWKALNQIEV